MLLVHDVVTGKEDALPIGPITIQCKHRKDGFMKKKEVLPDNIKPEMIGGKRYVRAAEGAKRYSVGVNIFRNMAEEAHAVIHVRRIVLIDTKMIDEYLKAFRKD